MEKHLIRTILTSLASIGKVEYRIKDEFTGFYRGKVLLGIMTSRGQIRH